MRKHKKIRTLTEEDAKKELRRYANKKKAQALQSFFKTAPGEYGAGDIFIGVTVPQIRQVAKGYYDLSLTHNKKLLSSPVHEERMLALLILVGQYRYGTMSDKSRAYTYYMKNAIHVNNWDLVDLSAPKIAGDFLFDKEHTPLYEFAHSRNLWKKRISIVATHYFIARGYFKTTCELADILIADEHDLIHKSVGWMLREVGKKNDTFLERFLAPRYKKMPRTMLRYAIERFPEPRRKAYLAGRI
jgi:3-methyladenine DNA glycosylase AlkD